MPIYEYACPKCKHEFEVLIRNDRDLPSVCPACGKGKPEKSISSFAVGAVPRPAQAACGSCPSAGRTCPAEGACCSMQ